MEDNSICNFSDDRFQAVRINVSKLVEKENRITEHKESSEKMKNKIISIERSSVVNVDVLTSMADRSEADRIKLKSDLELFIEEARAAESEIRGRITSLLTAEGYDIPRMLSSMEEILKAKIKIKDVLEVRFEELRAQINRVVREEDVAGKSGEEILLVLEAAEVELAVISEMQEKEIQEKEIQEKQIQDGKILVSTIIKLEDDLKLLETRDQNLLLEIDARREAIAEATNILTNVHNLDTALVNLSLSISNYEKRFVKGLPRISSQIRRGSSKLPDLINLFRGQVMFSFQNQLEFDTLKADAMGQIRNALLIMTNTVLCKTENELRCLLFMCKSTGIEKNYAVVRDSPAAEVAQSSGLQVRIIEGDAQEVEERRMKGEEEKKEKERKEEETIIAAYRDHEFDHHLARKKP